MWEPKGRWERGTQYLRRLADLVQFLAPKFSFLQLATIEHFSIIFRHFFDGARLIKRRSTIGWPSIRRQLDELFNMSTLQEAVEGLSLQGMKIMLSRKTCNFQRSSSEVEHAQNQTKKHELTPTSKSSGLPRKKRIHVSGDVMIICLSDMYWTFLCERSWLYFISILNVQLPWKLQIASSPPTVEMFVFLNIDEIVKYYILKLNANINCNTIFTHTVLVQVHQ